MRFRYKKRTSVPHNWETMPFYIHYLRKFLKDHDGEAVWLKGHTGNEEATYLVFNSDLREDIINLMAQPLAELGFYEVSVVSPNEVAPFLFSKDKVGSLLVGGTEIGQSLDELVRKARQGFRLAPANTPIACSGARFLKARDVSLHQREDGLWLCFHEAEETVCKSDGTPVHVKKYPELWLPEKALRELERLAESSHVGRSANSPCE